MASSIIVVAEATQNQDEEDLASFDLLADIVVSGPSLWEVSAVVEPPAPNLPFKQWIKRYSVPFILTSSDRELS